MDYQIFNKVEKFIEDNVSIIVDEKFVHTNEEKFGSISLLKVNLIESVVDVFFRFYKKEELSEFNIMIISESNTLFFRTANQWGVIDLMNENIFLHKATFQPVVIERVQNSIIIDDE